MFRAFLDGVCFYDDRLEEKYISDLKVTLEENKAGSFEFTIYPQNSYYSAFAKLNSIVTVEQNGYVIFRGRVLTSEESFDKIRQLTCEGEYAFFNDSITWPFGYEDADGSSKATPKSVFERIISNHNEQVPIERQFIIGNVSVENAEVEIEYALSEYRKSIDAFNDLLERCGGHFEMTHEEGGTVINWTDSHTLIDQSIEFGKNLLDLVQAIGGEGVITGILPHGDTNESINRPSNITEIDVPSSEKHKQMGVHRGTQNEDGTYEWGPYGHYIVNVPLYEQYGAIIEERSYDGYPADWLEQVLSDVDSLTGLSNSIEIEAVDLSWLNDVDFFRLGRSIKVKSDIHGIDDTYNITKLEIDLRDPASNKFTLGKVVANFIEQVIEGDKRPVDGKDAVIISYSYKYAVSDSGTVKPDDSEFTTSLPTVTNLWLWTRVSIKYSNGSETVAYYPSFQGEGAKLFEIISDQNVVVRNDRKGTSQTINFTASISGYLDLVPVWYVDNVKKAEGYEYSHSVPYRNATGFTIALYGRDADGTETLMDSVVFTVIDQSGTSEYFGVFNSIPDVFYIDEEQAILMRGDHLIIQTESGDRVPYYYDGQTWRVADQDMPFDIGCKTLANTLNDALKSPNTSLTQSVITMFCANLAAQTAFIKQLGAEYIQLVEKGAIYGGAYDKDGNVTDSNKEGFWLSATGVLKAMDAYLEKAIIYGTFFCADDSGTIMQTVQMTNPITLVCSPKTRWAFSTYRAVWESNRRVTYNGTAYTVSRFSHTASGDQDISIIAPWTTTYSFSYSLRSMGHEASVQVYIDNVRVMIYTHSDNDDSTVAGTQNFSVTAGQTIRIITNESYYSVASCTVKTSKDMLLFYASGASQATFAFEDESEYFISNPLVASGFNSASYVNYALSTGWASGIPEINRLYTCSPNQMIEYNGSTDSGLYVIKRSNSLEIMTNNGTHLTLAFGNDAEEFETMGWYWISGSIAIAEMQRGVHTANLIPIDNASIGDGNKRYAQGHFGHVNANSVAGDLTGNVNSEGTRNTYKVWGAVAN